MKGVICVFCQSLNWWWCWYTHSSPLMKGMSGFLEPAAPHSRSSDNLEKYSPLIGRRSQGDSPLTASPLARRTAGQEANLEGECCRLSLCQKLFLVTNSSPNRIWSIPTVVCGAQNYSVSGLCPSSGERSEAPTLLGPLERGNLNQWITYVEDEAEVTVSQYVLVSSPLW
jgi:hypothetical protein